jgi:hypothetical protein
MGKVRPKSKIRIFFSENYAIAPLRRGFGFKNRNLLGFSLGTEVPKPIFNCEWPGLPHIPG